MLQPPKTRLHTGTEMWNRVLWHLVLAGCSLAMLFPILWSILTSFKPANEIFTPAPIADHPTWENYTHAFARFPLGQLLANTTAMAAGVAVGQIVIAVLAAYALVHLAPHRRRTMTVMLGIALAVPPQTLIIPQFLLAAGLGWRNTNIGLIIPQWGACALAVLLLIQHVDAIPLSRAHAARLDGALPREILLRIIMPALSPAIAAVFILVFISTWNEYLWPLPITTRPDTATVQIGLNQFITAEGTNYGGLLAAAVLTALPALAVYAVASRPITNAFLTTGVK